MGYYTQFELKVCDYQKLSQQERDSICDVIEEFGLDLDGCVEDGWYGDNKWYDHDDDMIAMSKRFPKVVFQLYGNGEDSDDVWMNYYYCGKVQYDALRVSVTIDPFNKLLLVDPDGKPFKIEHETEQFLARQENGKWVLDSPQYYSNNDEEEVEENEVNNFLEVVT